VKRASLVAWSFPSKAGFLLGLFSHSKKISCHFTKRENRNSTFYPNMASLASILNPPFPTLSSPRFLSGSVTDSPSPSPYLHDTSPSVDPMLPRKPKMPKEHSSPPRTKPKGTIKFRPFEVGLDPHSLQAIQAFKVTPFGNIQDCCVHIPYNSEKKDFHEKTGLDGFEGTGKCNYSVCMF
jgi:hypothetical protein